ncbi:hypothetical protein N431DRAFT_9249 [Stipitochalara longipes BDJ]|nr:hypothetical protein N431DRAFT_9249 [Stipitochalara longipes BDJ]
MGKLNSHSACVVWLLHISQSFRSGLDSVLLSALPLFASVFCLSLSSRGFDRMNCFGFTKKRSLKRLQVWMNCCQHMLVCSRVDCGSGTCLRIRDAVAHLLARCIVVSRGQGKVNMYFPRV